MTKSPSSILLMVSVAVNLILIGIFFGAMLKEPNASQRGPGARAPSAIEQVTPEDRHLIRTHLQEAYESAASEREVHQDAKRTLRETLGADQLDVEAAQAQFKTLRETEEAMRAKMQTELLKKIPGLSQQQRNNIARRLLATNERSSRRGQDRRQRRPRRER